MSLLLVQHLAQLSGTSRFHSRISFANPCALHLRTSSQGYPSFQAEGSIYYIGGLVRTLAGTQHDLLNGRWDFINTEFAPIPPPFSLSRPPCNKVWVYPVTPDCYGLLQGCTTPGGVFLTPAQVVGILNSLSAETPDLSLLTVHTRTRRYSTPSVWYQALRPHFDKRFLTIPTTTGNWQVLNQ